VDQSLLIQRWQTGDAAAFAALVRYWQQPMARFLARVTGSDAHVPDLCQEVFLRLHLARTRYRDTGQFSSWLYRIAVNVARDALRRTRPVQPLGSHEPESKALAADLWHEQHELAAAVREALAELPPAAREVLVLRHYEEMSFAEMARVLDVPESTLKSRFAAALRRLRERLRPWLEDEPQAKTPRQEAG
jgi:RNA polymerase sigma-70 factor, ECF subfamily